jgi:AcrR family transcriptional regulator
MSSPDTRKIIADAAISLFMQNGYDGTSISDIRKASGATTGSIYHFFTNKAGLAIAIWQDAIRGWQSCFEALKASDKPEDQIKATVHSLLIWARANPSHFRVYDEILSLSRSLTAFEPIRDSVERGHAVSAGMYADWAAKGAVRNHPWHIARALMIGPSLEALRAAEHLTETDIAALVEAAWDAVTASARSRPG